MHNVAFTHSQFSAIMTKDDRQQSSASVRNFGLKSQHDFCSDSYLKFTNKHRTTQNLPDSSKYGRENGETWTKHTNWQKINHFCLKLTLISFVFMRLYFLHELRSHCLISWAFVSLSTGVKKSKLHMLVHSEVEELIIKARCRKSAIWPMYTNVGHSQRKKDKLWMWFSHPSWRESWLDWCLFLVCAIRNMCFSLLLEAWIPGCWSSSLRGEGERVRWTGAYAWFVHPLIYTAAANIQGVLCLFFHLHAVMSWECVRARLASVSCCFWIFANVFV